MSEKELIKSLHNLKEFQPSSEWKASAREILYSQLLARGSNTIVEREAAHGAFSPFFVFLSKLAQPVAVVAAVLFLFLGGGFWSVFAARDSKPGDSLYIAKVISEKARASITFDEKKKAKLGIEFAGNRAKELENIIKEDESGGEKNGKIEESVGSFKKEIAAAKSRVEKMGGSANISESEENDVASGGDSKEDVEVFSANLEKENNGIEISENEIKSDLAEMDVNATGTEENTFADDNDSVDLRKALEEAKQLIDEENYDDTLIKLEEINDIIDQVVVSDEEVQGNVGVE